MTGRIKQLKADTSDAVANADNALALPSFRVRREGLDEPVKILMSIEKRPDKHALILAVSTNVVDIACQARMPIRRDACVAQEAAVGGTRRHHGDHRDAGPEFRGQALDYADNLGV